MRSLCLVALLLASTPALAIDEPTPSGQSANVSAKTTGDYLGDLAGESPPDRLYAARVLRGQLRRALRTEARAREGTLAFDEARSVLVELEDRLPGACLVALKFPNAVAPCADMLAWLDVKAALPELQALLATEKRTAVRKRLEAAIAMLAT